MIDLEGKVALVTGAGRGIGLATAKLLLDQGCRVAVTDVDADLAKQANRSIQQQGRRTMHAPLDVRDADAFIDVAAKVADRLGTVDILVNNAGIMPLGGFLDQAPELDRRQIEINLFGVINGMRAVLPGMTSRRSGHIVNIASAAGKVGVPNAAVYSATKHAVVGLTEAVRYEMRESGVSFSYVLPSLVDTDLISGTRQPRWPPVAKPEHVAEAVLSAVQRGKVEVYVPFGARLSAILPAVFPRFIYERIGEWLKFDAMFERIDAVGRAAYQQRISAD